MVALRDDLIHPAYLEWSGVCTRRGEESRDNNLDSGHGGSFEILFFSGLMNEGIVTSVGSI